MNPAAAPIALSALLLVGAAPAAPVSPADWTLARSGRTVVAALHTGDAAVAVRCENGVLNVKLSGLPLTRGDVRALRVAIDDRRATNQTWTVGDERTTAYSHLPARLARELREARKLKVIAGDRDGRLTTLIFDLPRADAVEQALSACGAPLVDVRDAVDPWVPLLELPYHLEWVEAPDAGFPPHAIARGVENAHAVVTCVVGRGGAVRDCRVESEYPSATRVGRSTTAALHRARLRVNPQDPDAALGEVFTFRASWSHGAMRGGGGATHIGDSNTSASFEDRENPSPLPLQ